MPLRVLVPLDGSEVSFRALSGALDVLDGRSDVQITLFNVVSPGMDAAPEHLVERLDEDEDDEVFPTVASAERMLDRAEEICRGRGHRPARRIVTGRTVDAILAACAEHDLLVMHELGRSQIKATVRGSQTERLARRAGIHVLLVHAGPA